MIPPFDYYVPKTLQEGCEFLWKEEGNAKIIAGGTDLVVGLRKGDLKPRYLIDITRIEELHPIREQNDFLSIGASVTHSQIVSSSLIQKSAKILAEAACQIGSPQIRNLGTIGGNIINASPAADTLPPLMVLDAMARVLSKEGERTIPLVQLFRGPYQTHLKPNEILAEIRFRKLPSDMGWSFIRLARRNAMAIARMSVAVLLRKNKGCMEDVRISVGAVTPTPQRMSEGEALLEERPPDEAVLKKASLKVSETMIRQSGVRPSTSFKRPVVEALFLRAIRIALEDR
jgi:CO/xanthine dehydrogenase FAD-binding subunit